MKLVLSLCTLLSPFPRDRKFQEEESFTSMQLWGPDPNLIGGFDPFFPDLPLNQSQVAAICAREEAAK